MKQPILTITALLLYTSALLAQDTVRTGYVNFNMGASSIKSKKHHAVTLLGCNTIITNASIENWRGAPNGLEWNTKNQVFTKLPYAHQIDKATNKPYYVSKYYIASPPVFYSDKEGRPLAHTPYDIGIVTPDQFVFDGDKPLQQVYMDYDILKLMKIQYIPVVFDTTFDQLMVDIIPFKVACKNFPWIDKNGYYNAKGASGIGYLNRKTDSSPKLFLPYYEDELTPNQSKQYLDCEVSILNDILFHREVYFMLDGVNGAKTYSINLKDYYNKHKNDKEMKITLYCAHRSELACGCQEPALGH